MHSVLKRSSEIEYRTRPSEKMMASIQKHSLQGTKVRLFVSSTFRDMQEERNLLVKKVVPDIKRLCRKRGVNFSYIDFRWGITAEESTGGKMLSSAVIPHQRK